MKTPRILAAGDHFLLAPIIADALRARLGDRLEIAELTLPWPLEPFGDVAEVREASGTEAQMIEALAGATICVTHHGPLTARVAGECPDLELFAVARGGPVNANVDAATRHDVVVTFAPGRNAGATAEYTVGMILAAARRIPSTHAELLDGRWRQDHYAYRSVGLELGGSTVGLIGCGAIGTRVARLLAAFGAEVLVFDPYADPAALQGIARQVDHLRELLAASNVVSLHARLTPETAGIVGASEIAAMPRGSVLVNCARGGLLDYDAACDALDSGHLAAAAFDVFADEPLPAGSRLLRTPNVVLTPHLGGASRQTARRAAEIVADDVARFVRGQPPQHCANPDVLERLGRSTARDTGGSA